MRSLFTRLHAQGRLALDLWLASLVIHVLALVSSVYSIQVMNRYTALGLDGTLVTLTSGALLAVLMEYLLRQSRFHLAQWFCQTFTRELHDRTVVAFATVRHSFLEQWPPGQRQETLTGLGAISQAFSGANLSILLDAPFALLYLLVIGVISPMLALLTLSITALVIIATLYLQRKMRPLAADMAQETAAGSGLLHFLATASESVRMFHCFSWLQPRFQEAFDRMTSLRQQASGVQAVSQHLNQSAATLSIILLYAAGAYEVVHGHLDVGSLIGCSILASRAFGNLGRLAQLSEPFEKARQSLERIDALSRLPVESQQGVVPRQLSGGIELENLSFAYPGQPMPVLDGVQLTLAPGQVLAVVGDNGRGKTTMARLLTGLLEPDRGQIRVDGMDLRHLVPEWWRRQILYLPQEPLFFDGTLRENLTVLAPHTEDAQVLALCQRLQLGSFLDTTPLGLATAVRGSGATLPLGVRRRLALVRAMLGGGRVAILDEPTEGIDASGCQAVARLLNEWVAQGLTVIVMTREEFIIRSAHVVLDLHARPLAGTPSS
ncbi:MAG: ATP-binding cassette domain-containing protein [Magnetococcales bacterium]|nr:ATP-binding cassette domain-containing protein [Magnetococcales bacterium]